jgi:hypothetical protein
MADNESILLELDSQEEARFWAKVRVGPKTLCWPWDAKSITWGYGSWRVRKILFRSNRVAWILHHRKRPPAGLDIRHSCHFKRCCNPWHLTPGTRKQNMQDSVRAGHTKGIRVGSKNGRALLDEVKVREIKERLRDDEPQKSIAESMGISRSMISLINTGHSWPHVP